MSPETIKALLTDLRLHTAARELTPVLSDQKKAVSLHHLILCPTDTNNNLPLSF